MSHQKVRFFFCILVGLIILKSPQRQQESQRIHYPIAPKASLFSIPTQLPLNSLESIYIDPSFARSIQELQPAIIASAQRHNNPEISPFTDYEFALILTAQLYFEHNAVLATRSNRERDLTYVYQEAQRLANTTGITDFSIWPSNLRPTVGLSLLRGELPYIDKRNIATSESVPIIIHGSRLYTAMQTYPRWEPALNAINNELADPILAIEYMAANFEIGLYRAHRDWVPVYWSTLVAWHNQGIVDPQRIERNAQLQTVLSNTATYLPYAASLYISTPNIAGNPEVLLANKRLNP